MSVQAGIWHFDERPIPREQLRQIDRHILLQGPDARGEFLEPGFAMLHRSFHVTKEDRLEKQPLRGCDGSVLTWDGRLDNRDEILSRLGRSLVDLPTDAEIVSASLSTWGTNAFARFVGDWALAWWIAREKRLILARDYIGVRKLYYTALPKSIYWCTDLTAVVLHGGQKYGLCDDYFAGYFTTNPAPQLTPYEEIQLVPPGGFVEATPNRLNVNRYWTFNTTPDVNHHTDSEYEEHFLHLFRQAVCRRLRTTHPILADLSGGLDSSSIVCMAYDILRAGESSATINTISMYSLQEPGGDERPYFMAVEDYIGKKGTRIELAGVGTAALHSLRKPYFAPLPGYFDHLLDSESLLVARTGHQGNRVHLSGLGGDELLGGVQDPVPELARLLYQMRLPGLRRQLERWALQRKTTVWSLLRKSVASLFPIWLRSGLAVDKDTRVAAWLQPKFVRDHYLLVHRRRFVTTWRDWLPGPDSPDSVYLSLASSISGYLPRFTFAEQLALPYYDRDLVSFLFAVPQEQLLRPHQRRSLMRRALRNIVPETVVNRKSKWLGKRVPALQLLASAPTLTSLLSTSAQAGRYIDSEKISKELYELLQGKEISTFMLERVLGTCFLLNDASAYIAASGSNAPAASTSPLVRRVETVS